MYDPGYNPNLTQQQMNYNEITPFQQQYNFSSDPINELLQCQSVVVIEEPDVYKMMTGKATFNRFHIMLNTQLGQKYGFICKQIDKYNYSLRYAPSASDINGDLAVEHSRFHLDETDCCKVKFNIFIAERMIGQVCLEAKCFTTEFFVNDFNGNKKYTLEHFDKGYERGEEKMAEITYNILKYGSNAGSIRKLSASYREARTNADSFEVTFPPGPPNLDERIIFIALCIYIDRKYFEDEGRFNRNKPGTDGNGHGPGSKNGRHPKHH